jgi:hypothetical protein
MSYDLLKLITDGTKPRHITKSGWIWLIFLEIYFSHLISFKNDDFPSNDAQLIILSK